MNQVADVRTTPPQDTRPPLLTRMSLFSLSIIILSIGIVWRVVDIFVLGLGSTLLNILPSKLFPLGILLGVFWVYRRSEIEPILGLTRAHLRPNLIIGILLGLSFYFTGVVLPTLLYASLTGASSLLTVHIQFVDFLWYEFLFVFINAIMEETLFRGILYHGFRTRMSINRSMLLSAAFFGLWHICWPFANGKTGAALISDIFVSVVFSGILGLFFAIYYIRFTSTTALTGTIVAHTLINFFNESFKFGASSGMQGPDTPTRDPLQIALSGIFFMATIVIFSLLLYKYKLERIIGWFRPSTRAH
ncbi:MAG: CPBP family intramembrane metalloprotease [Candidatus Thorarchaeota archaeon]|nr:CPBP family intramembrane metalloprotease [Candidatus Thorarchaeota archaeon]